jgi:filamentous hemagglutinin family protein
VAILGVAGLLSLGIGSSAYALPGGGTVSAGAANISSTSTTLTVNQSSQNAAINWQSFSIAKGESVTFQQPNANSVALNRVLGADPSAILGSLSANGKVFLVNPNGILFAQGAQVNVGGLVASTLDITDSNFMPAAAQFSIKVPFTPTAATSRCWAPTSTTKASSPPGSAPSRWPRETP